MINDLKQIQNDIKKYEKFFEVKDGDIVVDIGAHVGLFVKEILGKAGKIYAIEPDPLFFSELIKLKSNKLECINKGIWNRKGVFYMVSDGNANTIGQQGEPVETVTFFDFLKDYSIAHIDFLKIDCEGGEYSIFTDEGVSWIKDNVRRVAGEFHIHNTSHRGMLKEIFRKIEHNSLPLILTDILGNIISKEKVFNGYTEIMFYI